jgi:hypothetical protein
MDETDFSHLPQIDLFGVTLLEPFNVLTNIFIASLCWISFYRLQKARKNLLHQRLARYFLLIMGLATIIGGVLGHGFLYVTGLWGRLPGWFLSMLAVALMERAAIIHTRPLVNKRTGNLLSILNYIELAVLASLTFYTLDFIFVEIHATYGLLFVVFSLELYVYLRSKDSSGPYFFLGTGFGVLALIVHELQWGINFWFNYNDVTHVIMLPAIWYYYKAIDRMGEKLNSHTKNKEATQ